MVAWCVRYNGLGHVSKRCSKTSTTYGHCGDERHKSQLLRVCSTALHTCWKDWQQRLTIDPKSLPECVMNTQESTIKQQVKSRNKKQKVSREMDLSVRHTYQPSLIFMIKQVSLPDNYLFPNNYNHIFFTWHIPLVFNDFNNIGLHILLTYSFAPGRSLLFFYSFL